MILCNNSAGACPSLGTCNADGDICDNDDGDDDYDDNPGDDDHGDQQQSHTQLLQQQGG